MNSKIFDHTLLKNQDEVVSGCTESQGSQFSGYALAASCAPRSKALAPALQKKGQGGGV